MAKHPHKLLLIEGRTWRCVLDGCAFFVHLGLAHVITGKRIICWNCEDTFQVLSELSTKEPRPICPICKGEAFHIPTQLDIDELIKQKIAARKKAEEDTEDEVEVEVTHTSECASYSGDACDCGAE